MTREVFQMGKVARLMSAALAGAVSLCLALTALQGAGATGATVNDRVALTTVAQAAIAPTLDWGDEKIEYYSNGVVLGYHKGEDMGMRILGNNFCFNGTWVGTGKWTGSWSAAGSKYGDGTVVRSAKGKKLTVLLPEKTVYKRTTAKKAAKLWGTTERAKKALKKCWWNY
jgi:hypothetical protein